MGKAAIVVGVLAAAVCVFSLFIQVQVTVIDGADSYFCGGLIDSLAPGDPGAAICAEALSGYVIAAVGSAVVALGALTAGTIVLVRNPL